MLEQDYKENITDMMQMGILIHMTSDKLQGSQYSLVKEKAVNFLDDWARLPDQVAMDVGCCGHYKEIMTTTIRRKSVLSLRTCCATGARGTGTGPATVPPQPRGLGKTKVSRVTARESRDHSGKGKGPKGDGNARWQQAPHWVKPGWLNCCLPLVLWSRVPLSLFGWCCLPSSFWWVLLLSLLLSGGAALLFFPSRDRPPFLEKGSSLSREERRKKANANPKKEG